MSTRLVFLVIASLIVVFVLLAVYFAHNVQKKQKAYFSLIGLALIQWQVFVYVTEYLRDDLVIWNNATFWGPALAFYGSYKVVDLLTRQDKQGVKPIYRKWMRLLDRVVYGAAGFLLVTLLSNQIFTNVTYSVEAGYTYERGLAYIVYVVALLTLLACVIAKLVVVYRSTRDDFQNRTAIKIFMASIVASSLYGVITNIIVPLLTHSDQYLPLGLLSIDIFAGGLAIAIIRYRFLDIRAYVFRSVVYVFTLLAATAAYVLLARLVTDHILHLQLGNGPLLVLSIMTLITAVGFQPMYRSFNRITSRVFYRDAYDPQDLFNEYNKALVSTIDLEVLLHRTSKVVAKYLNADFCLIDVKDSTRKGYMISGTQSMRFEADDIDLAHATLPKIHRTVVTLDQMNDEHDRLRKVFNDHNIAAMVRLKTGSRSSHRDLGYIMMGTKKSGNPYNSQDEKIMETLANELIIALQNALRFEEIENFNSTLQEKVNVATRQLRQVNEKLKALDKAKDDFISLASHQLRTPLTSIKGYTSLLLEGAAGRPPNDLEEKFLKLSFGSAQRMVGLISDLLNLSRIKTGKFVMELAPCNLAEAVTEEVDQLRGSAAARSIELVYYQPEKFSELMLDSAKIHQVIMNFIDNAIYYSKSDSKIVIELKETPQSVEFTVSDSGIGVPQAVQHNLFTKFYRADNARQARPDGTGIGLYMAKKVVTAQGGSIVFRSTEGKGSTFGFTFEKAKLQVPANYNPDLASIPETTGA